MRPARLSANRKYAVCGNCRRSLCRRDWRDVPGGPAVMKDGRLLPGKVRVWGLAWDDGWHPVEDHIERQPQAADRLAAGRKPIRHDWTNAERLAFSKFLATFPPAKCDECGEVNAIDPKRLAVSRVLAR